MVALTCKMCGGALSLEENSSIAVCEYCGTKQTVPNLDDEKKAALFERANLARSKNEFDKAAIIYETILNDAPEEAEAFWGLCLCRYGIEYVEDPRTNKRIPTCHRTQFKSILDDADYLSTIRYASFDAKDIYTAEAQYIDKVQKDILAISSKEEPFDIFICYKETDANGDRTKDSVIAQDIYSTLTDKGYKVFFSRITLEDKLGSAYEPYIFAALNSSKIMLAVGSDPEYYEAVWVKNEWSRYLSLIEQGQKKTIIPCYRDMTINDMPREFTALQALDVSKLGYMQDLVRGIEKILGDAPKETVKSVSAAVKNVPALAVPDIKHIQSMGAQNKDDFWPKGTISSTINKNLHPVISFQLILNSPIDFDGHVELEFFVFDENSNIISDDKVKIKVSRGNDRLAKTWILNGNDGSSVATGAYKAVFSVNGGPMHEYKFNVTASGYAKPYNSYKKPAQKTYTGEKSLFLYCVLCLLFGYFGVHSFYAGKKVKGIIQIILTVSSAGLGFMWAIIDLVLAIKNREVPL